MDEIRLAELLNAKFSHDLAGPIGAICNGIEFLGEDDPLMNEKALSLIETSSRQATVRLQFFRQLFGSAPNEGDANLAMLHEVALNYFNTTKVEFHWDLDIYSKIGLSVSYRLAKLILNIFNLAASTLIKGGTLKSTALSNRNEFLIKIAAEGQVVKFDDELYSIIKDEYDENLVSSKNIHVYYLLKLIKALGVIVEINKKETFIEFNIRLEQS